LKDILYHKGSLQLQWSEPNKGNWKITALPLSIVHLSRLNPTKGIESLGKIEQKLKILERTQQRELKAFFGSTILYAWFSLNPTKGIESLDRFKWFGWKHNFKNPTKGIESLVVLIPL